MMLPSSCGRDVSQSKVAVIFLDMLFQVLWCHRIPPLNCTSRYASWNKAPMWETGEDRADNKLSTDNDWEDLLYMGAGKRNNWDLMKILPSGSVDVRSCLDPALISHKICLRQDVKAPCKAEGVFHIALKGLKSLGEHPHAVARLVGEQELVQELTVEVMQLCEV